VTITIGTLGQDAGVSRPRTVAVTGAIGVTLLALLVRLPLMKLPLDPDEGGYAYVAQRWAAGERLYSAQAWVDRPQGLLLLFRAVTTASYSAAAIRVAAVLVAVVLAFAVGAIAWALAGRVAALVAAVTAAVLSAGPLIEGYQLNGELAASAVGCAGLALAFGWRSGSLRTGWLLAAGLLCGAALLMKQSAIDTTVVLAALAATRRRWVPVLVAGAGVVGAPMAAALNAAVTGWSDWWYAVVTFQRTVGASQTLGGRWDGVRHVAWHVAPELAAAAVAAVVGLVLLRRRPRAVPWWAMLLWLVVALLAVASGPYAHPHYWIQMVAPLSVLVGVAAACATRRVAVAVVVLVLAVPLCLQVVLALRSPEHRASSVVTDHRLLGNDEVAAWIRAHSSPDDRIYAFVASADVYLLTDRLTGYPYLWQANVEHIPSARPELARYLSGPQAPRFVIVYQKPKDIDPDGILAPVLSTGYTKVAHVGGYDILERTAPTGS
jgi:4-amino-4-deoxy-L-arabinose transferase-like glycosyltransferase